MTDDTLLRWTFRIGGAVLAAVGGWKFLIPFADKFITSSRRREMEAFDGDVMASLRRCAPAVGTFMRADVFPDEIEAAAIREKITREFGARMSGLASAVEAQKGELAELANQVRMIPKLELLFEANIKGQRQTNRMLRKLDASQHETALQVSNLAGIVERVVKEFDSDRAERRSQTSENQARRAEWPATHPKPEG